MSARKPNESVERYGDEERLFRFRRKAFTLLRRRRWGQACLYAFSLRHPFPVMFCPSPFSAIFDNLDNTDRSLLSSGWRSTSRQNHHYLIPAALKPDTKIHLAPALARLQRNVCIVFARLPYSWKILVRPSRYLQSLSGRSGKYYDCSIYSPGDSSLA